MREEVPLTSSTVILPTWQAHTPPMHSHPMHTQINTIHAHICTHIHVHRHTHTHHVCTCAHAYMCIHVSHVHTFTYTYIYTMHAYHLCAYTHAYAHMHSPCMHMYAHTQIHECTLCMYTHHACTHTYMDVLVTITTNLGVRHSYKAP